MHLLSETNTTLRMKTKTLKQSSLDAKNERKKRNNPPKNLMELPFKQYVMDAYTHCSPNYYGQLYPKKVARDVRGYIESVPSSINRGDCHINYATFMEFKISYKSKDGESYSITNIRGWQDFDYFVLCFVDPDNNFKTKTYCVPKSAILENDAINLTGMNNTADINQENTHVGYRATIKAENLEWLFEKHNVLKTTNYASLLSFVKTNFKISQKNNFKKTPKI